MTVAAESPFAGRAASLSRQVAGRLNSPLTSYYLVLGATVTLTCIGLVMVLSSSSVESIADGASPFTEFWKQAMFAALGLPGLVICMRVPPRIWQMLAWPMLLAAFLLQALTFVPHIGVGTNGNHSWIAVAGFTLQPAEVGKLALIVWGATVLVRKRPLIHRPMHALIPVVPGAGVLLILIMGGKDLGTAMVVMAIVAGLLFVAGAPLRIFAAASGVLLFAVLVLVQASSNRLDRIGSWMSGCSATSEQAQGSCFQSVHGQWALASGGWWGVGLGGSREKWGLLPEAHNDFIFAIVGEELGLVGTLLVIGLLLTLCLGLARIVLRTDDEFVKIATSGVLIWVVTHSVINIGGVVGLLPIVGMPLPLVSSGGTALITMLAALGMVLGFARRESGVAEALAARAGLVQRSLAVLPVRRNGRNR
ncbi:putative lipid II flippase FtsW [Kineosporia sp. J2-2]|uniref:Probable peptidoglycan glycosyltransferase FtsW n=1 Tax=Kineosporia corallincola TaxID=2835133 RepID=A0ABS5TNB9_9ACTN|nr:putative lipid II flippase FtsW [Kineosporia corallincola]MBT0771084.1 putative lipid II flippase FtsW [Kineosporia corallincola]